MALEYPFWPLTVLGKACRCPSSSTTIVGQVNDGYEAPVGLLAFSSLGSAEAVSGDKTYKRTYYESFSFFTAKIAYVLEFLSYALSVLLSLEI